MAAASLIACSTGEKPEKEWSQINVEYPITNKQDSVIEYFGTSVNDPYSWLENDTSSETESWVKSQNEVTSSYLAKIPFRDRIAERYTDLFNYEKVSAPQKVGEYYFMNKNDGLQNQSVIYYKKGEEGEWMVFMDPNKMSEDGTVTVGLMGESKDKKYIAYRYSEAGSDWGKIKVRDIEKNEDLDDVINWVKFSGASWYKDGFYYSGFPAPEEGTELSAANQFHTVYYHKLGTDQSEDVIIYQDREHPNLYHGAGVTEDEEYLVLYINEGTDNNDLRFKKPDTKNGGFQPLVTGFRGESSVVDFKNDKFLVITDIGAPMKRLVAIDPSNVSEEAWVDIIPESENNLESVSSGGGKLFASYLINAANEIYMMNYDGTEKSKIELPGTGSAGGFYGDKDETKLFYSFTSFIYPSTIFEFDVNSASSKVYYQADLDFDPAQYVEKQVWFTSKDGTKVPMFLVHKKDLKMDGTNPTLLYGYGGFNISLSPYFSTSRIILLENGGIYAMVNLRGGGEFGEEWHAQGMKMNKQNVFDDFIGAAEYLINEKYTSSEKLAIEGGSNGGLLVGACMAQRPDLFRVALPHVGVMDMLKYHKFTIGWGWVPEYGSSEDSEEMFQYLYGYSPLHNLKDGTSYPATMVFTADHDDRVVPAHSFKFGARLQEAHQGENPVLMRIETRAGHGAGKPTSKIIEEEADKWAFMFYNMKYNDLYPEPES